MSTANAKKPTVNAAEAEIRSVIEGFNAAVLKRDVDAICAYYDKDIVSFDAIKALQFKGRDAYRQHWQECMDACPNSGEGFIKQQELTIQVSGDTAFSHCIHGCGGPGENGEINTYWMRYSAGYRKINGNWLIVHEHYSAPFDMQTLQVLNIAP